MIPPLVPEFVGREAELERLDQVLQTRGSSLLSVHGLGGVGKTALVSRYIRDRFDEDKVAWIPFQSERDPQFAFEELRRRLSDAPDNGSPEIVVLDDVDELSMEAVLPFLRGLQDSLPSVPVVVTSRYSISSLDAETLPLGGLDNTDALALLRNQLATVGASETELTELAQVLGYHPLALRIAAGLAKDRSVSSIVDELRSTLYDLDLKSQQEEIVQVVRPRITDANDLLVRRLRESPEDLLGLSPRRFEELISYLLGEMGWETRLTRQTRDGGRDILAYLPTEIGHLLCLVEAKRFNPERPVGVGLVRNLYGTLCDEQANSALLVTTSRFTPDAREFQQRHVYQLALKDYHDVVSWINRRRDN